MISFKSAPKVLSKILSLPAKLTTSSRAGGTASPSTKKSFSMPSVLKGLSARAKPGSRQSNPVKMSQAPNASEAGHREDMVKDAIAYMKGPTAPAANRPRRLESGLSAEVEARFQALKGGPLPPLKTLFDRADALARKGRPVAAHAPAADDGLAPLLLARFEALKAGIPARPGPGAASEAPPDLHEQVQALRKRFYPAPSSRTAPPPAAQVPRYTKAAAQALGLTVPNRAPPAPPSPQAPRYTRAEAQALGLTVPSRTPPAPPSRQVPRHTRAEAQALGLTVPNRAAPAPPSFDTPGNVR